MGSSVQLLSKVLVGLAYLYALPSALKRSLTKFFTIYFFAIFIFLLHYAIFTENRPYIDSLLFPFFFMCLPAFIYSMSVSDLKIFKDVMRKASYIVFCFGVLLGGLVFVGRISIGAYSMTLSYYMLLPTVMFLDELMDKFSAKMLVFAILSLLTILALGARGPILCIVVFGLLKFIRPNSKRTYKRVIGQLSLLSIGLVILVFLEKIMMSLYDFLLKFGINSRSLVLFFQDGVHLSGRDRIYETIIKEIIDNPIIGIGIAGDRPLFTSGYVHNIFFEILANFGIIIGSLISILLLIVLVQSLKSKDIENYNISIIWISLGLVHLLVSSSYLIDMRFWIFIGFIVNVLKKKRNNQIVNKENRLNNR